MSEKKCSVEGCGRKHSGHGYCGSHLWRIKQHGTVKGSVEIGAIPRCRRMPRLCSVPNCGNPTLAKGLCSGHYQRQWEHGEIDPLRPLGDMHGKFAANWKGGIRRHKGYIRIFSPDHPFRSGENYVPEHRLVMEKHLGRYLTREEVVHHRLKCEGGSGRTDDNRIENLVLFSGDSEHRSHHLQLKRLYGNNAS